MLSEKESLVLHVLNDRHIAWVTCIPESYDKDRTVYNSTDCEPDYCQEWCCKCYVCDAEPDRDADFKSFAFTTKTKTEWNAEQQDKEVICRMARHRIYECNRRMQRRHRCRRSNFNDRYCSCLVYAKTCSPPGKYFAFLAHSCYHLDYISKSWTISQS